MNYSGTISNQEEKCHFCKMARTTRVMIYTGGEQALILPWRHAEELSLVSLTGTHKYINIYISGSAVVKNLPASAGDTRDAGSIPGLGRSPGRGNGNLLQYSCLENFVDRGAWWVTVHGDLNESDMVEHTHISLLGTLLHSHSFSFFFFFFCLYWLCYNIASVLCFGFLAKRHVVYVVS